MIVLFKEHSDFSKETNSLLKAQGVEQPAGSAPGSNPHTTATAGNKRPGTVWIKARGCKSTMTRKDLLIEKIKKIVHFIATHHERPLLNMSVFISNKMNLNYTYLSNLFSANNNMTIEHYFIKCKIEKACALLVETDTSIQHIAQQLHYSSKAHFSHQFKKVTGLNPSQFRKLNRIA